MDAGFHGRNQGLTPRAEPSARLLQDAAAPHRASAIGKSCAIHRAEGMRGGGEDCAAADLAGHAPTLLDRQWTAFDAGEIARRIAAAAREAVTLHVDACVRDGAAEADLSQTQAASLLRLARASHATRTIEGRAA